VKDFERNWKSLEYRLKVVPGKLFLSSLNEFLQKNYKISITPTQIINHARKEEIDRDLIELLNNLEKFKQL
jgi:hypothetical protein